MRISSWFRGVGAAGVALAMIAACTKSVDMPAALGDEGSTFTPPGGGGGGMRDAGDGGVVGEGGVCTTLPNNATQIAQKYVGEAVPVPMGGAIVTGTYYLTAANVYTGVGGNAGPTGSLYTETTVFDTSTNSRNDVVELDIADGGVGVPVSSAGNYATSSTTFTFTTTCGTSTVATYTYTATPTTVSLYAAQNEYVFTLQ